MICRRFGSCVVRLALTGSLGLQAVGSAPAPSPTILAGPVPNPHNGHLYYLLESASWTASEARAVELGGHLVAISDDEECDWIFENFSFFGGQARALWSGLNDAAQEGVFVWSNGEPLNFENWALGEPNALPELSPVENYVFLYPTAQPRERRWRDGSDPGSEIYLSTALWTPAEEVYFNCQGLVEVRPAILSPVQPSVALLDGHIRVSWEGQAESAYQIQSAPSPAGPWSNHGQPVAGTGTPLQASWAVSARSGLFVRILMTR